MAEYYSAELSQKVKRGMRETRAKGNFGGGNILYGYKVVNKKIVINEDEAEVVRKIFAERVSGKLVSTIAQDLKIMGIKNHNGNLFSADNVYRILINEKYIGIYRHGDEIHTDTYPQIVPTEIFEIVASKIANNKYGKHKPDVYYLLKHKIFCGYCSNPIQSASGTSKNGEVKRYYRCSGKVNHKKCSFIPKRKDILEELVIDTIYEALNESNINYITERILESHKKQNRNYSTLNLLIDEQKEVSSQINNIMKAIEKGIITETTKSRLEELEKKKIDLQIKIEYEQSQDRLAITENDIKYYLLSALKKAPRLMIDALINKIILYNDKAEIYLKYTNHKSPDDNEDHQDFLFYVTSRSYDEHGSSSERLPCQK